MMNRMRFKFDMAIWRYHNAMSLFWTRTYNPFGLKLAVWHVIKATRYVKKYSVNT